MLAEQQILEHVLLLCVPPCNKRRSTLEVVAQHSSVSIAAASSIDTTSIKVRV